MVLKPAHNPMAADLNEVIDYAAGGSELLDLAQQTDCYVVIGHPIAHSKSPLIHGQFARQSGQSIYYGRLLVPQDRFAEAANWLFGIGVKGANVTVPFKLDAFAWAQQVQSIGNMPVLQRHMTVRAQLAGAVNTLKWDGCELTADNTDGVGLVNDIALNHQIAIRGKSVVLLGAGGAARGVLQPLLEQQPAGLTIVNRTVAKAQALCDEVAKILPAQSLGVVLQASGFDSDLPVPDIIINATSTGLSDELVLPANWRTPTSFGKPVLAYDMMYGKATPFMQWAQAHGAQVADGLGMLVEQAAAAFDLWRQVKPDTQAVLQSLR